MNKLTPKSFLPTKNNYTPINTTTYNKTWQNTSNYLMSLLVSIITKRSIFVYYLDQNRYTIEYNQYLIPMTLWPMVDVRNLEEYGAPERAPKMDNAFKCKKIAMAPDVLMAYYSKFSLMFLTIEWTPQSFNKTSCCLLVL